MLEIIEATKITDLPPEIICAITKFMRVEDYFRFSRSTQKWKELCDCEMERKLSLYPKMEQSDPSFVYYFVIRDFLKEPCPKVALLSRFSLAEMIIRNPDVNYIPKIEAGLMSLLALASKAKNYSAFSLLLNRGADDYKNGLKQACITPYNKDFLYNILTKTDLLKQMPVEEIETVLLELNYKSSASKLLYGKLCHKDIKISSEILFHPLKRAFEENSISDFMGYVNACDDSILTSSQIEFLLNGDNCKTPEQVGMIEYMKLHHKQVASLT